MFWYWAVFISLVFFLLLEQFRIIGRKKARVVCAIYSVFFVFMSTIRWNQTLGDWEGYYKVFNLIEVSSLGEVFMVDYWPFEPVYYLAMRLVKYLTGSYTVLLFLMSFVATVCFYLAAVYLDKWYSKKSKKSKKRPSRSIMIAIYLAFWSTSLCSLFVVRTNIAVAICLCAIKYIEKKSLVKFIIAVALATMIHFVAVIFLLAYPIYRMKIKNSTIVIAVLIAFFAGNFIVQRLAPLVSLLGGRYAEKVDSYFVARTDDFDYLNYSTTFIVIRAVANSFLMLCILFYIRANIGPDKRFNGLFNIYALGVFVQFFLIRLNMELARMAVFFTSVQFFVLPYVFRLKKNSFFPKPVILVGYVLFMAVKLYSLLGSSEEYDSFTTIFTEQI